VPVFGLTNFVYSFLILFTCNKVNIDSSLNSTCRIYITSSNSYNISSDSSSDISSNISSISSSKSNNSCSSRSDLQ
jgi:hypothetical protein